MKPNLKSFIGLVIMVFICACCSPYADSKKEREERAKRNQGDIVIGVIWPQLDDNFIKGIDMATAEINKDLENNAQWGVLKGRKFRIVKKDSSIPYDSSLKAFKTFYKKALALADSLATNPDVVAVVGHRYSSIAIPTSVTYQYHGILFLAPTATNLELTRHHFDYVFQMMPNNTEMGKRLATHCSHMNYQNIAILHERKIYAEELADSFFDNLIKHNIKVAYRRSFFVKKGYINEFKDKVNFSHILAELKKETFDAIFLSTGVETAKEIIKQSRQFDIRVPFIGGENLGAAFWNKSDIQKAAEGTIIPTVFNESDPIAQQFITKFNDKYNGTKSKGKIELDSKEKTESESKIKTEPNYLAALGYDAIKLLALAMKNAQSTVPIEVATQLRYMSPWYGVTGKYQFTRHGEIKGKKLYLKVFRQGKFEFW